MNNITINITLPDDVAVPQPCQNMLANMVTLRGADKKENKYAINAIVEHLHSCGQCRAMFLRFLPNLRKALGDQESPRISDKVHRALENCFGPDVPHDEDKFCEWSEREWKRLITERNDAFERVKGSKLENEILQSTVIDLAVLLTGNARIASRRIIEEDLPAKS